MKHCIGVHGYLVLFHEAPWHAQCSPRTSGYPVQCHCGHNDLQARVAHESMRAFTWTMDKSDFNGCRECGYRPSLKSLNDTALWSIMLESGHIIRPLQRSRTGRERPLWHFQLKVATVIVSMTVSVVFIYMHMSPSDPDSEKQISVATKSVVESMVEQGTGYLALNGYRLCSMRLFILSSGLQLLFLLPLLTRSICLIITIQRLCNSTLGTTRKTHCWFLALNDILVNYNVLDR